jgi:nitroreductase
MELLEAIKTRRSVREFTSQRIPDEHIEMILDAARYAPSPENLQMWRYVVIRDDQEMKDLIADVSVETARMVFGAQPYEATAGRLWYLPDHARPAEFEDIRDGSLFTYPKYSDTVVMGFGSEFFHDSHLPYAMELFGSVVVGMGMLQMWLVAHSLGYGCGWMALAISDYRHKELLCDKLGVPRTWEPVGILCIGVPKEKRMLGPSRFPLEGVMYSERWGNPYRRLAFRKEDEKK